ncbi:PAS domain-containing sensor histidine kinase [Pedobacter sp. Leaf170]|uniref:PAS domain-containing sensor histidine kinase n=1 Tax=Pedobacter sp. Leaf170 TaxID=2876558 RepID=UPI001E32D00C|nr:PAS domain-containing sensor histidine kinase [Pedobacter sp. Leaf170]
MTDFTNSSTTTFSDETLLEVLQNTQEATAIYTNENLFIRFANNAMLNIWGKERTIVGKNLEDALPEIVGQPFINILKNVWRTGVSYYASDTAAELIVNGERQTFYFDFEYRAMLDENQKTYCIIHTSRDVSQRRASLILIGEKEEEEQAINEEMAATVEELLSTNEELNKSMVLLADSREHIRTIIEQAPVGICVLEGDDLVIDIANKVILNIWGRKESEVIGKPHELARPELKGQPVNKWLRDVYETGIAKVNNVFRVMLYQENGLREAFVNSIYQPIKSSSGQITGILVILEEITNQILASRAHEKNQLMLAMAIDAGELGTFFYEPENNLFSGNDLLKSWFGLSSDDKLDLGIALSAIHEEDRELVSKSISEALMQESGGRYAIDYRIRANPDAEFRTVQAIGRTTFDTNGKALSLNGTVRDITEQKKDEQRKDDFISMVSHELKTPLTSLNAYIQLLQRTAIKQKDKDLEGVLQKALKQIRSMTSMINGFLNVSRLESGKMSIDATTFDVKGLFDELESELSATIHTHHLEFITADDVYLNADRDKIAQVVQNLVGNAVKYSPMSSTITIGYAVKDDKVVFSVEDKGMGIAEEDQEHIFERYYRVKNQQMGSIAGFGIGLYLCKEIIERHGGNIWLNSEWNNGTTFYFQLSLVK